MSGCRQLLQASFHRLEVWHQIFIQFDEPRGLFWNDCPSWQIILKEELLYLLHLGGERRLRNFYSVTKWPSISQRPQLKVFLLFGLFPYWMKYLLYSGQVLFLCVEYLNDTLSLQSSRLFEWKITAVRSPFAKDTLFHLFLKRWNSQKLGLWVLSVDGLMRLWILDDGNLLD